MTRFAAQCCPWSGTAAIYDAQPSKDKLVVVKEWDEPKFRPTCRYIGLDVRPQSVFSSTILLG